MPGLFRKKMKKAGLPPGTVIYDGEARQGEAEISVIDYDENTFNEDEGVKLDKAMALRESPTVTWINVIGIHDTPVIEKIGEAFNIHSLVLEDIASQEQRPKFEDYEEYFFVIVRMMSWDEKADDIASEQVSLIVGRNYVISFQEHPGDVFDPVRSRIRTGKGRIRKMGADYLAYSLLDVITDNYFSILERIGDRVEDMQEQLLDEPSNEIIHAIHRSKRELIYLRRSIWPLREAVSGLERSESKIVNKQTKIFVRDLYDHAIQAIDTVESLRDVVGGTLDLYMSSVSNRMNEVMKVLTIFAAIFIPLTFIAGVYGMNFEFMPELRIRWAYPVVWAVMITAAVTMIFYFRKKRWL
jgi:magnesium transporter